MNAITGLGILDENEIGQAVEVIQSLISYLTLKYFLIYYKFASISVFLNDNE